MSRIDDRLLDAVVYLYPSADVAVRVNTHDRLRAYSQTLEQDLVTERLRVQAFGRCIQEMDGRSVSLGSPA